MAEPSGTDLTLAAIRHVASRVRAYADRYDAAASSMEKAGIQMLVDVANSKSLQMGLDRFFSHLKGVEEALDRAMLGQSEATPMTPTDRRALAEANAGMLPIGNASVKRHFAAESRRLGRMDRTRARWRISPACLALDGARRIGDGGRGLGYSRSLWRGHSW